MKTRILTAVIAAACVIIAGCSTTPETPDPPTVTLAPSTGPTDVETESPTPFPTDQLPERLADLVTKPVLPDDANEFTADGAAAFAQFVIDAATWAYATGDSEPLIAVCDEASAFCQTTAEHAELFIDGSRIRYGGRENLEVATVDLFDDDLLAFVAGEFSRDAYVDVDPNGALIAEKEAEKFNVRLQMRHINGAWLLEGAGTV